MSDIIAPVNRQFEAYNSQSWSVPVDACMWSS